MVKLRRSTGRGEYSRSLGQMGRFVLSHKALVAGVWWLLPWCWLCCFPSWKQLCASNRWTQFLGRAVVSGARSRWARRSTKGREDHGVRGNGRSGRTPGAARQRYDDLVVRLRADRDDVQAVARPASPTRSLPDKRSAKTAKPGTGRRGQRQPRRMTAATLWNRSRDRSRVVFTGTSTTVHVTGPTATFSDQIVTAEKDPVVITIVVVMSP